ncbi:hypothetical protein H4582DRAFT_1894244 [Lactarius indigo]|nr:hypothetical protein H4582DRAFT_1894244 [Lactarius indigo]
MPPTITTLITISGALLLAAASPCHLFPQTTPVPSPIPLPTILHHPRFNLCHSQSTLAILTDSPDGHHEAFAGLGIGPPVTRCASNWLAKV